MGDFWEDGRAEKDGFGLGVVGRGYTITIGYSKRCPPFTAADTQASHAEHAAIDLLSICRGPVKLAQQYTVVGVIPAE